MAISEDFKKLGDTWKDLSLLSKVFGVCTVLFSALSVASIADAVFKFKGFILTGIEFYKSFTEPLRIMLSDLLWFEIPEPYFHMLILGLVGTSATLHASRDQSLSVRLKTFASTFIIFIAIVGFISVFPGPRTNIIVLVFAVAFPISLWFFHDSITTEEDPIPDTTFKSPYEFVRDMEFERQRDEHIKNLVVIYIIASYLLVCIIAGISEGIARTG